MDTDTINDSSARVLVVDDEGANRYSVSKTLQRVGYRVDEAASGEDAIKMLENNEYDVVLTDIRMNPGFDGVELLRLVKQQSPDAIVILMTGYASLPTAVEAIRLGAHDYIIKPSSSQDIRLSVSRGVERARNLKRRRQLLGTIKQDIFELTRADKEAVRVFPEDEDSADETLEVSMVAHSDAYPNLPVSPENTMQLGPLTVHMGRYQVSFDNQRIDLTPTEFDLLLYLAAHRGRVVPCHELVREVRGYQAEESEAREVIRPHVSNLRRKLQNAGRGADIITNVRGIGYRLSDKAHSA